MQNFDFLTDGTYGEAVLDFLRTSSQLDLAVAYWSSEILDDLELRNKIDEIGSSKLRVICDLGHPACHRQPIEELIDKGVCVKRMKGLHAKVWVGQDQVIIGSANSSKAALHLSEPSQVNAEAGVRISDEKMIEYVGAWFNRIWESKHVNLVTAGDLKRKKQHHPGAQSPSRADFDDEQEPPNRNRPFEYFVGEQAGRNYRVNLGQLKFCPMGKPGNLRIRLEKIENMSDFSNRLADAIEQLLGEAQGVGLKKKTTLVPQGFREQSQGANRVLYERIAELVESHEGSNLWLKSGESRHTYSLRLAHKRAGMKEIALLTLQTDKIDAAQNR